MRIPVSFRGLFVFISIHSPQTSPSYSTRNVGSLFIKSMLELGKVGVPRSVSGASRVFATLSMYRTELASFVATEVDIGGYTHFV